MLNKLKKIVKKYGVFHLYSDELFKTNKDAKCYLKFKKQYSKYLNDQYENQEIPKTKDNKVWVCWLQGMENAPELVQACYESLKKNLKNKEIIVLTSENLKDYVTLPDFIMEKWKKGIISNTHFSDILRMEVLIEHGGTWIDSTCFCTSDFPDFVENSDFFAFRNDYRKSLDCKISSWFISSKADYPLLKYVRDMIFAYWQKENELKHYFLFHFFVTMAMEKYPKYIENMFFVSNINPHVLLFEYLFKPFDEKIFENLKKTCFIHKLSYKFDLEKINTSGTFYEKITTKKLL